MSKEEWTSVLTLAFSEKICFGRESSIPSWVIDGYIELVQATTVTDLDALQIDLGAPTTAYKLFRIRELRIAGELSCARTKVEEIFKEELDRLRSAEEKFSLSPLAFQKRVEVCLGRRYRTIYS